MILSVCPARTPGGFPREQKKKKLELVWADAFDGGASRTPEYLILSVEVGGKDAVPAADWVGGPITRESEITDFVVDYVRAYRYKTRGGC